MAEERERPPSGTTGPRPLGVLLAVALISVVVLGSVRFGRLDRIAFLTRTGDPIAYVTETGRSIDRTVVDERQYLSMVAMDRGAARSEIAEAVLYTPFVDRPAVPWLASRLPVDDEGFALALVNLACTMVGIAAVILALRRNGASDTSVWIVVLALAVNWNTLMFAAGLLIDPVVLMFMAVGWLLLVTNHPWGVVPMMAVAYPLKETALLFGAVLAAWVWQQYGTRRPQGAALVGAAGAAGLAGMVITRATVDAEGAWDLGIKLRVLVENQHVLNLAPLALAILPVGLPAVWRILQLKRVDGWWSTLIRPEVVGFSLFAAVTAYTWISHDLSPRLFFLGAPFAAWLAVEWFDTEPAARWIRRIRSVPLMDRVVPAPPQRGAVVGQPS